MKKEEINPTFQEQDSIAGIAGIENIDEETTELLKQLNEASNLTMIIALAWQIARRFAVKLIENLLAKRAEQATTWPSCPKCGGRLESKGKQKRQLRTIVGIIRWRRRVGRCPKGCKIGQVAPLDDDLGLQPNQRVCSGLKRLGCMLAVFVPFNIAAIILYAMTGVEFSSSTIWEWVQEAGKGVKEDLEQKLAAMKAGTEEAIDKLSAEILTQSLLLGADGVMVPFRPNGGSPWGKIEWREIKVGIIARLGKHTKRSGEIIKRIQQRSLVAVLGSIEELAERMMYQAARQEIGSSETVLWLSDGGIGYWRVYAMVCAGYTSYAVLDFYHMTQNLWKGINAWLGEKGRKIFSKLRHDMRHGKQKGVMKRIKAAMQIPRLGKESLKGLKKLYNYLDKHKEHIEYKKMKELGLPIGSGMVESACKWLIQQRFKGVGMRWSEDGFNHLLHLRLAWVNGTFDDFFAPPM